MICLSLFYISVNWWLNLLILFFFPWQDYFIGSVANWACTNTSLLENTSL